MASRLGARGILAYRPHGGHLLTAETVDEDGVFTAEEENEQWLVALRRSCNLVEGVLCCGEGSVARFAIELFRVLYSLIFVTYITLANFGVIIGCCMVVIFSVYYRYL